MGLELSDRASEYQEFHMMIKLNPTSCFVAKHNGEIIGSVFGLFNGRRAWIYHLSVDPVYQNQGIGTKLMQSAEQSLFAVGANKIRLWVNFSNLKVITFYEKLGYKAICDALMLGKDLKLT